MVCGKIECKRFLDRLRSKKYYRSISQNPDLRNKYLARKKREREAREARKAQIDETTEVHAFESSDISLLKPLEIENLSIQNNFLLGLLSLVTGSTESGDLKETINQCIDRGAKYQCKIVQSFPHVRLSSNNEFPHVRDGPSD